jgi:hypothetical protein
MSLYFELPREIVKLNSANVLLAHSKVTNVNCISSIN